MLLSRLFALLALFLAACALAGCPGNPANFSPAQTASAATLANSSSGAPAAPPRPEPRPLPKRLPRDSEFAVYHNPDYGISFRYPRNFDLLEQSEASDSDTDAIAAQQELAEQQPGALLVAIVSIPSDAYPNTTFVRGTLQFAVNAQVPAETCYSFAAPPESDWYGTSGSVRLQGVTFYWQEESSTDSGIAHEYRDYSAFSSGDCYEFQIEVAAAENYDAASETKPADIAKIMRALDKIVLSIQLLPVPAPAAPPASATPPAPPILTARSSADARPSPANAF